MKLLASTEFTYNYFKHISTELILYKALYDYLHELKINLLETQSRDISAAQNCMRKLEAMQKELENKLIKTQTQ